MTPAIAPASGSSGLRCRGPGVGDGAEGEGTTVPPGNGAVAVVLPTDVRQMPVSKSAHLSEPAQELTRKRPREVDQAEVLPDAGCEVHRVPALSVEIGGGFVRLPPCGAGQKKPPSVLLCGCAIALGPEQGSGVSEIARWIADRYSMQGEYAMEILKASTRATLHKYRAAFRHTNIPVSGWPGRGRTETRWVLENPAAFATNYGVGVSTVSSTAGTRTIAPVSSEPPASKRSVQVGQTEMFTAPPKPADRAARIAGFTWTLPPDPGRGRRYPSVTFLVGAAISCSESCMMKPAEIYRWIRVWYPSRSELTGQSIVKLLRKRPDFINTRTGKHCSTGGWKLRDPQEFGSYYEKDIYQKHRLAPKQKSQRVVSPSPGSPLLSDKPASPGAGCEVHLAPALSADIGGRIVTLPPYSAGQERPPLKLLCGCAIALGPEQGSGVSEIVAWIADRYCVRQSSALHRLRKYILKILNLYGGDFRCTDVCVPMFSGRAKVRMKWVLRSPADFAARHGGV